MCPRIEDLGISTFNRRENADIDYEIVETQQVIPDDSIDYDKTVPVYYDNEDQKSSNFISGVSGWIIYGNGNVEFNDGIFRGSLIAGSIHIPDENTTASSFHTNTSGDTWWGTTSSQFLADNENAIAYVLADGTVKFRQGKIGGFTLSATEIKDTAGTMGMSSAVTGGDDIRFWSGHATPASAPFYVTESGALVATSATITGSITATTGSIGGWTIGATTLESAGITLDSGNKRIFSTNYVSGAFGAGFFLDSDLLEVGNASIRGMIRTSVFQKDTISAVGGSVAILDADVLATDMTALDSSTLTIEGNTTFAVGDMLRIKNGTDDEWLEVTNIGSAPTYTVTRDKDAQYTANNNPAWTKGASVVNYGQSGDGGLYMTASETNAPYMSIFTHAGSPWDTITTQMRFGNLNGSYGFSNDYYGIGIGDSTLTGNYLTYDSNSGNLVIKGSITILNPGDIDQTDLANSAEAGATVGATWGTNLGNIPATLGTPSGAGLYLGASYLGYYDGVTWKTYMDNSGNFYLGGTSGSLQWVSETDSLIITGILDESKIIYSNSFGDGSDGNVTISSNTSLTSNMYYDNLTVNTGVTLTTNGYLIFVKDTLTNNGTIDWSGKDGANGGNGDNESSSATTNPGAGGAGGAALTEGFLTGVEAGKDGGSGGEGGLNGLGSVGLPGDNGESYSYAFFNSVGVLEGIAGKKGGNSSIFTVGGAGGTAGALTKADTIQIAPQDFTILRDFTDLSKITFSATSGGSGGGAGGLHNYGSGQGAGGGGAGGVGSNGGVIIIFAKTLINNGTISADGGDGGNGGNGGNATQSNSRGGGGGSAANGANGGIVVIFYYSYTDNGSITYAAGTGGTKGTGGTSALGDAGDDGLDGSNGNTGFLIDL